jgi:dTDP-4-amino-4,6-dideoxygalactose transaminase
MGASAAAMAGGMTIGAALEKPALLGGKPIRTSRFPRWPVFDETEEQALIAAVRGGRWNRNGGKHVARFEESYASLTGAKFCIGTSSGTGALQASLAGLGVGPGDEVILPPYTFVASLNVVLNVFALPVFVDSDVETSQIDAAKIEAAITERTAAIMPVHMGGSAADLDAILEIAGKHKIPVVEDACQSHLAEWRGRKVGTYGSTGCFSFQASKNLNCGEGGAILTNDEQVYQRCFAAHYNGKGRGAMSDFMHGTKFCMTDFQAAVLVAQMTRLERQAQTRENNARYLTSLLSEIPGISRARMYEGCTRNAYHLYMCRYDQGRFGLPRATFLKAMQAERIPVSGGYTPLNKVRYLRNALHSRGYQRIYSAGQISKLEQRNQCPANDRLCQEAVWLPAGVLLGTRSDMDQIAEAIRRIRKFAPELARA